MHKNKTLLIKIKFKEPIIIKLNMISLVDIFLEIRNPVNPSILRKP